MKITPEEAQLSINAFNAHIQRGMPDLNYGRAAIITADKMQDYVNEEAQKKAMGGVPIVDMPPAEEPADGEKPPADPEDSGEK